MLMRTAVGRFGVKSRGKDGQELLVVIRLENILVLSKGKYVKVRK